MDKLLPIVELGQPILRQKSEKVKDIKDKSIQVLIDDLIFTVKEVNGVGISAVQTGQAKQVFILASHPNQRYPKAPEMAPLAIINPKIIAHSNSVKKDWEGCLSIPGIRALVPRWEKIAVEFTDRQGKIIKRNFTDFVARIFQHEFDHLNGIVFIDRIESTKDVITEKEYQKIVQ